MTGKLNTINSKDYSLKAVFTPKPNELHHEDDSFRFSVVSVIPEAKQNSKFRHKSHKRRVEQQNQNIVNRLYELKAHAKAEQERLIKMRMEAKLKEDQRHTTDEEKRRRIKEKLKEMDILNHFEKVFKSKRQFNNSIFPEIPKLKSPLNGSLTAEVPKLDDSNLKDMIALEMEKRKINDESRQNLENELKEFQNNKLDFPPKIAQLELSKLKPEPERRLMNNTEVSADNTGIYDKM